MTHVAPPVPSHKGAAARPKLQADTTLDVAAFNVENLFDPVQDDKEVTMHPRDYQIKLSKLSHTIKDVLHGADLIALEELEGQRVLDDLLKLPDMQGYKAAFLDGNDRRGINVALLYRTDTIQLNKLEQANPDSIDLPPSNGQKDPAKLFARPPLIADVTFRGAAQAAEGAQELSIMVNHFKSKIGGPKADTRREQEGAYIGGLVDARRAANPKAPVIVLGDLNTLPGEAPLERIQRRADGSERMIDIPQKLPADDRYSYLYHGDKNLLDHMLVTPDLAARTKAVEIQHVNSSTDGNDRDPRTPNGMSDHDPLYASFDFGAQQKKL